MTIESVKSRLWRDGGCECFALLDDYAADSARPTSRLYTDLAQRLVCRQAAELPALLAWMQTLQGQGLHAVGLFTYELGAALQGVVRSAVLTDDAGLASTDELAQILLFERCELLSAREVTAWLDEQAGDATAGITGLTPSVSEAEFHAAIARIHRYIEAGDTYQVNYSYRLRFATYGPLLALYRRLRARQPVPFGACIALPDGRAILSFSPELGVRHAAGRLDTLPMKGTAPAAADAEINATAENATRAAALASDPKNRAENLMIVDLLRNDLGRIAQSGSVQVSELFKVSRYGRVLQMTSAVSATAVSTVDLAQTLAALLPFGSISGAPKRRTLEIIRELETTPRGYYTGAIGWFAAPHDGRMGDFCLSVPIRTLVLGAAAADGGRQGEIGVGAGIVHDSQAAAEFAECQWKLDFLAGLGHEFSLFETLRASRAGCDLLPRHLQRLFASTRHFGFRLDEAAVRAALTDAFARLPVDVPHRLRLTLASNGEIRIDHAPLTPIVTPVTVLLAAAPIAEDLALLRHKTTRRARYDAAWHAAEARGAFDVLFHNAAGELTEGGRSSLFVKLAGRWYTPPLAAGLLPGVMRQALLADPAWAATEKSLTVDDLHEAEAIVVCNALRGVLPATIDWRSDGRL